MVTVKDLIEHLQKLPEETVVYDMTWQGIDPLSVFSSIFKVYQKDKDIRLFVDDGEAFHPEDKFCTKLFDFESENLIK